ncbi:MAG: DoxX family protein [Candidatus Limnocylindrales bacterium]
MAIDWALAILHVWLGIVYTTHGAEKVLGLGGDGFEPFAATVRRIGFRRPRFYAALAGSGELVGGPCLVLGLLTPIAAAWLTVVMVVAITRIHGKNGFLNQKRGYEYQVTLIVVLLVLTIAGPGTISLDALLGWTGGLAPWAYAVVLLAGLLLVSPNLVRPLVVPAAPAHTHPAGGA